MLLVIENKMFRINVNKIKMGRFILTLLNYTVTGLNHPDSWNYHSFINTHYHTQFKGFFQCDKENNQKIWLFHSSKQGHTWIHSCEELLLPPFSFLSNMLLLYPESSIFYSLQNLCLPWYHQVFLYQSSLWLVFQIWSILYLDTKLYQTGGILLQGTAPDCVYEYHLYWSWICEGLTSNLVTLL